MRIPAVLLVGLSTGLPANGGWMHHRADATALTKAEVTYVLRVDSTDLAGFDVEMHVSHTAPTFEVAMAAHPEYDDAYWRYVERLQVESPGGAAVIVREDSALWRISGSSGETVIRYRLQLPQPEDGPRAAWRPFISPTGALIGGPHSFMYVVGSEASPARVTLQLPAGWDVATGLARSATNRTFSAPDVATLVDSPILVGRFHSWRLQVDGIPHRIVYWPLPAPDAAAFDTVAFVHMIRDLVHQTLLVFGGAPYRDFTFLIRDGAFGALEHANSVSLGVPSADLARDLTTYVGETEHEFFHTWNLMAIHPAGYGRVDYRPARPTRELWFAEGLSVFYADLLPRRAHIRTNAPTRLVHLQRLMERYLGNPGDVTISPERVSTVAYGAPPDALGDLSASVHLQGELLGSMIDFIVRDGTRGKKTIDDVMRTMYREHSGPSGYTGHDIESTVASVCRCAAHAFFEAHVRGNTPIDFDRYLGLLGLRARVEWQPSVNDSGRALPDSRVWAWLPPGQRQLSLLVRQPRGVWGRAGLHSGDRIIAINGESMADMRNFRSVLRQVRIGDTLSMSIEHEGTARTTTLVMTGFDRPVVTLEERPDATAQQRALRAAWLDGR